MSDPPHPPLPLHSLGRAARNIAPVIWELSANASSLPPEAFGAGADWCLLSSIAPIPSDLPHSARLLLGVPVHELELRRSTLFHDRLRELRRGRVEGILIENADPGRIKAGGPFHRLLSLRDQGLIDLLLIEAADYAEAEWMVHHTPAHAVCLPFGIHDQTARYRLLPDARAYGTGIIARINADQSAPPLATNISFIAAEPDIASMIVPASHAPTALSALRSPMTAAQRDVLWTEFTARVPEPPKPTRNLPPELA